MARRGGVRDNIAIPNIIPSAIVKFNWMVVGESGLGKTSMTRALWGTDDGGQSGFGYINAPTVEVTESFHDIPVEGDDRYILRLKCIDTPGYGDSINLQVSFNKVLQKIQSDYHTHARNEQVSKATELKDNELVHLCLYFLATPRIKTIDIELITQLKNYVNVIPVIAKADQCTETELEQLKGIVVEKLSGIIPTEHIFAIVGTLDERDYKWGKVQPWTTHKDYFDNQRLSSFITNQFLDLKKSSEEKFEAWRKAGRKPLVRPTVVVDWQKLIGDKNYLTFAALIFFILLMIVFGLRHVGF